MRYYGIFEVPQKELKKVEQKVTKNQNYFAEPFVLPFVL